MEVGHGDVEGMDVGGDDGEDEEDAVDDHVGFRTTEKEDTQGWDCPGGKRELAARGWGNEEQMGRRTNNIDKHETDAFQHFD